MMVATGRGSKDRRAKQERVDRSLCKGRGHRERGQSRSSGRQQQRDPRCHLPAPDCPCKNIPEVKTLGRNVLPSDGFCAPHERCPTCGKLNEVEGIFAAEQPEAVIEAYAFNAVRL